MDSQNDPQIGLDIGLIRMTKYFKTKIHMISESKISPFAGGKVFSCHFLQIFITCNCVFAGPRYIVSDTFAARDCPFGK